MFTELTPEIILAAYQQGIFPMAEDKQSPSVDFYRPKMRGQLSIPNLHIPKKLLKHVHQAPYDIKINTAFDQVIEGCAGNYKGRETTWINEIINNVFIELHEQGHAHSVEAWQKGKLVGGLYGLAIGAVFCGESMFSTADNASKIALVHLCTRLHKGAFTMLDTQFTNSHLKQFGIYEIPQEEYEDLIQTEMKKPADFILEGWSAEQLLENYFTPKSE